MLLRAFRRDWSPFFLAVSQAALLACSPGASVGTGSGGTNEATSAQQGSANASAVSASGGNHTSQGGQGSLDNPIFPGGGPSSASGGMAPSDASAGSGANTLANGQNTGSSSVPPRTTTTLQTLSTQVGPTEAEVAAMVNADAGNAGTGTVYVSLAHLVTGSGTEDLEVYRFGLTKVLNSVSIKAQITRPVALDQAETVYRIQLADYSLTAADLAIVETVAGANANVSQVGNATLIKGDWLVYALTRPEVYDKVMQLPNFIGAAASFGLPSLEGTLGVDHSKSIYIVAPNSEVTFSTRVLERSPVTAGGQTDGYYWRSYDFLSSADPEAIAQGQQSPQALANAVATSGQLVAGEMFFSLPNGLQGSMLSGFQQQHRIDAQALVATDHNRGEDGLSHCVGGASTCGYVINGESCMVCHSAGIKINPNPTSVFNATMAQASALLLQDQARYLRAVNSMGFTTVAIEPIGATLSRYRSDNGISDARQQGSEVNPVVNLSSVFNR